MTSDAPVEAVNEQSTPPNSRPGTPPVGRLTLGQRLSLSNVRIGRKIGLGFAVVLALTVGVSFLGWNGQKQISRQLERTDAAVQLFNALQEIRKDEKNYQIVGDETYFTDALAKVAALKERAEAIKALFDSAEDRQRIERVGANVANYEAALTRYHDLEVKKGAALERMLQKSEEMEKASAELRDDEDRQFGELVQKQTQIEGQRDARLGIADEVTKLAGQMADLLIEMQQYQISHDEKRIANVDQLGNLAVMSVKNIQALLGADNADVLPDDLIASIEAVRADFKKFAETVKSGGGDQVAAAAELEQAVRGIKGLLDTVALTQRLDWESLAGDAQLAKIRMQKKQAVTLQTSGLIENVNKMRVAQMQYLRQPSAQSAEQVRGWTAKIVKLLESLDSSLSTAEEKAKAKTVHDGAEAYSGEFDNVVGFFVQQAAASDTMLTAAQGVNGEISQAETDQKAAMAAQQDQSAFLSIAGSVVALVLGVLFAIFISRSITGPLTYITGNMRRLAEGDTSIVLKNRRLKNEIGDLSRAMQVFLEKTVEMARMREEQAEKDRRAEQEKKAAMVKMADQFETSVGELVEQVTTAASEMQSSSEAMSATAEETTRQASAVAAASEQASTNVETVASAAEELSSSIGEISRQVARASEIASGAVRQAEATNAKVQGLAQAANKIGEVVALITDIAEQTNLLALNATIEAARAGDAGKGFAVVASEVKNLANQTARATDEIGAQIVGIQTATQEAVSAIQEIGKTITEIDEVNSGVAAAVEEQGAATQEIARNVEQASAGTQEVSSNIAGVSQAANETGSAAAQIHQAANRLSSRSGALRNEVDRFLAGVRAA